MTFVLLDIDTKLPVLAEITAALAILTDEGMISSNLNHRDKHFSVI